MSKFNEIIDNIKNEREKSGLSAYELSLRIGKDASYINKLEKYKMNISLKVLLFICDELQIGIEELLQKKV